jgi:molybdate transport system ATP-binding protein
MDWHMVATVADNMRVLRLHARHTTPAGFSHQSPPGAAVAPVLHADITLHRRGSVFTSKLLMRTPCVIAIWGPSGCGKTTLLRSLAGLEKEVRGTVAINGATLYDTGARIHVPPHCRRIGYVFQNPALFDHLTVRGNLLYGLKRAPHGEVRFSMERVVGLLELAPYLDRKPSTLSGGERQRIAIGRALLGQPVLLMLDEPLSALDAAARSHILGLLAAIKRDFGLPMLYVTHHIDEIARLADRVCLLEAGSIVAEGPRVVMMGKIYRRTGGDDSRHGSGCGSGPLFHDGHDCPYEIDG